MMDALWFNSCNQKKVFFRLKCLQPKSIQLHLQVFVRHSMEIVNQYINTWWHQLLINGSTLQQAPIHRKCNAVIICRKYNIDTQRIMFGISALWNVKKSTFCFANLYVANYVKHIHSLMSQRFPYKKEILQIFFADNYDATMLLFSDVRAMKSIPVHPDKMQIELA